MLLAADLEGMIPEVRAIALGMLRRAPANVEREEYVAVGLLAMVQAAKRFDDTKGIPFKAFMRFSVRGAIMDRMRQTFWGATSGRRGDYLYSLEHSMEQGDSDGDDREVGDTVIDLTTPAVDLVEAEMLAPHLLNALDDRSRYIVWARIFERKPNIEVARELGVCEGRVSQLYHAALREMRRVIDLPGNSAA